LQALPVALKNQAYQQHQPMEERQTPAPAPAAISGFVFRHVWGQAGCQADLAAAESRYSLDNRRFVMAKSGEGLPQTGVVFVFHQTGVVISGDFRGGDVRAGQLLGRFVASDHIELHFHFLSSALTLHSGTGSGLVSGDPGKQLTLFLNWRFVSGGTGTGAASYKEV
jgi:hypothetical protein